MYFLLAGGEDFNFLYAIQKEILNVFFEFGGRVFDFAQGLGECLFSLAQIL